MVIRSLDCSGAWTQANRHAFILEYVGYEVANNLVDSACQEMGLMDLENVTFGQMVDRSDRLGMAISRMVGFD